MNPTMINQKITKLVVAIAAILIFPVYAKAQVWCPPGATWYYSDGGEFQQGYSKYTYVIDTVIKGINCKKLTHFYKVNGFLGVQQKYFKPEYVYSENGVSYLYNNSGWYGEEKFDTLYNINAKIGDKWHLPRVDTSCVDSMYVMKVLNTGTKTINGFNLKWLYVKKGPRQIQNTLYYDYDTITERVGFIVDYYLHYCNSGVVDESYQGTLRCYSDDSFGSYSTGVSMACDYITGIKESKANKVEVSLYPNPTNDKIHVQFYSPPNETITLRIYDFTGRLVQQATFSRDTEIPTNLLDIGVYTYLCTMNGSYIQSGKISVIH